MARKSLKNVIRLIDKQNEPPEQSFLSDLKRSIEIYDEEHRRQPSKTFKPSGMKCARAMYFECLGYERDETPASYTLVGICNSGSDIHERIQKAVCNMKETGMDCEYIDVGEFVKSRDLQDIEVVSKQGMETKLYHKTLNMSFLCDGIIKYKGKYYILELKTETTNKFWNRKCVDPNHHNQATAYSLALGLDDVIFVYICRDNLEMKSFMFHVTGEMRLKLLEFLESCQEYIDKETEPPIPNEADAKFCQYCAYKSTCKGAG